MSLRSCAVFIVIVFASVLSRAQLVSPQCIACHSKVTPEIVADWKLSRHSHLEIGCDVCHGKEHTSASDVAKAKIPTPDTCAMCHPSQVDEFKRGKHAQAWTAMTAMPNMHWQAMGTFEGARGCAGCHKIGLKTPEQMAELRQEGIHFGAMSCASCHMRHSFLHDEAKQPQVCEACHAGSDDPQAEMYSSSKHGFLGGLETLKLLPSEASVPTCETCHMPQVDHEVRAAWGFLGVSMPMPGDKQWAADQATILEALGMLDAHGTPTGLMASAKTNDVMRFTQQDWQRERDKMVKTCDHCHSDNFAKQQLESGDKMIQNSDHLLAEGIRVVAGLYQDGVLPKPKDAQSSLPNLPGLYDAPTAVEQRLYAMYLKDRMHAFKGAFHANPDYAFWHGWSETQNDLAEIRQLAADMRRDHSGSARKSK